MIGQTKCVETNEDRCQSYPAIRFEKPEEMERLEMWVRVVTLPLVLGHHRQSRCMWCGLGCWICPAVLWPGFDWEAVTQTGAVDTGRGREVTAYRHSCPDRHSYLVFPSRLGVPVIVSLLLASSWDFLSGTIWQNDGNYFPFHRRR